MANTQLQKTPTNTNSRQKFTFSFWLKRSKLSSEQCVWTTRLNSSNNTLFRFNANDTFTFKGAKSGSDAMNLISNALFRDTSGWYNVVIAVDTTQLTDTNRVKIYVNGVQETSFATATYPSQNLSLEINEAGNQECLIGSENNQNYFDGSMSYFAFVSETQELPGIFGETDSTTGEWKIKTTITPSVAWGTNGFLILVNGNSLTDESTNSNNFALGGGTLTKTEDCPSNVFSTINVLYNQTTGQGVTVTFGNNLVYYGSDSSRSCIGSTSPSSGKYYYEAKVFDNTNLVLGIVNLAWGNLNGASGYAFHDDALNFGYDLSGQKTSGGTATAFGSAMSNNDIFMCAMDLDNQKLYFGLNGTWQGSGDPTSGATGTGSAFNLASGANYAAACRLRNGTQVGFNFGNGYYSSSSQVSSAGTNASGIGIFEYDVPNGYTALSTKGLNL